MRRAVANSPASSGTKVPGRPARHLFSVAVLVWALAHAPSPVLAEDGDDSTTASHLRDARELVASGQWADAVELFQRVIDSAGDDLVPADEFAWPLARSVGGWGTIGVPRQVAGGRHRMPARWVCHRDIAALPPAGLAVYRQRADGPAGSLVESARRAHDPVLLERVLANAFCAAPAEEAIQLLAERALERGDFSAAGRYWRMLLPPIPGEGPGLSFPTPRTTPAVVKARLVLLDLLRGDDASARRGLASLERDHPKASGRLAGRDGPFVHTLRQLIERPGEIAVAEPSADRADWPTFAGDPSRNSLFRGRLPYYWPDFPAWRVSLAGDVHREGGAENLRSVDTFPIVWKGHALVCDAHRVRAFNLLDGRPAPVFRIEREDSAEFDLRKVVPAARPETKGVAAPGAQYTLTAAGELLLARLGSPLLRPAGDGPGNAEAAADGPSLIACFGPASPESPHRLSLRWLLRPGGDKGAGTLFEGTPLAIGDRLYVATLRLEGGQLVSAVACFGGLHGRIRPELLWQQDAGKSPFDPTADARTRCELLTRSGETVVFCSPAGKLLAFDARTGKPAWEFVYPKRAHRSEATTGRDVCPCLEAGGRVFAAPADGDRVFCLDGFTGRPLWESGPLEVIQLLGVSRGRLICTLDRPLRGVVALSVESGSDRPSAGWLQQGDVATFGRGFLSNDVVFWPTRQGIQFLGIDDGLPVRTPLTPGSTIAPGLPLGNLAFGEGCLVAVSPTELVGFVSESRLLGVRRRQASEAPDDRAVLYRLALAEADAYHLDEAQKALRRCGDIEPARRRLAEMIGDRSEIAFRDGRLEETTRLLEELSQSEVPGWQAYALARLGWLDETTGKHSLALTRWGGLLGSDRSRSCGLVDASSLPRPVSQVAAGAIGRLLRTAPGATKNWEQAARESLRPNDPGSVEATAKRFPFARAAREALLDAIQSTPAGDSLRLRRAWLRLSQDSAEVQGGVDGLPGALAGLARAYEAAGYVNASREVWKQLARKFGNEKLPELPGNLTASEWVAAHLREAGASRTPGQDGPRAGVGAPPPLCRCWRANPPTGTVQPLLPIPGSADEAQPPILVAGRSVGLFGADGTWIRWAEVGHVPVYMCRHADSIIAAGPCGISRLGRSGRAVEWEWLLTEVTPLGRAGARLPLRSILDPTVRSSFASFRIGGCFLYCIFDKRLLIALDLETGRVRWQLPAGESPSDRSRSFGPNYFAGETDLLVQRNDGAVRVVDAATGKVRSTFFGSDCLWRCDPIPEAGHSALFANGPGELVRLELADGRVVHRIPLARSHSLTGRAPQMRQYGRILLMGVNRNHGFEVERLDPRTLASVWPSPWVFTQDIAGMGSLAVDEERIYGVDVGILRARSLADGGAVWDAKLHEGAGATWRITASKSALLLHPDEALEATKWQKLDAGRAALGWMALRPNSLVNAARMSYHSWVDRQLPVWVADPQTGRWLQCVRFPARGPAAGVWPTADGWAVATADDVWGLRGQAD